MRSVSTEQTFRVGDRVLFRSGGKDEEVEVIEDPLGDVNPRYVRIRIPVTHAEPMEITVLSNRVRPVPAA